MTPLQRQLVRLNGRLQWAKLSDRRFHRQERHRACDVSMYRGAAWTSLAP
ncbi:MAG TPA: hypothetical protein VNN62_27795 [Methylomirabilota bacterium]|nr:hypothetical protein [Methylomirabilota bacterium]